MAILFKKCKLFDKTFAKATKQVQSKFKDFVNWKKDHPHEKFGSSDYAFSRGGHLSGFSHAKLNFDVSIVYKVDKDIIYLYGVFSHDDIGTGQPANINKQDSAAAKFSNQVFENDRMSLVKMMTQQLRFLEIDLKEVNVEYRKSAMSRKKECFNNSFKALSGHPDSLYVLGYVFLHNIPIEHAWIKEGDRYFDVTLDPEKQHGYVSVVEIPFDKVMEYIDKHSSAPSLYDLNRFYGMKREK